MPILEERYKDDSLNIADAGEKVKALINEHFIDLGINPKIPPIELLSDDFLAHVQKHSGGDAEANASEMEHAIRKHCTVHFDEDPAFYKRLSEKLEKLIEQHRNNWKALAEGYEQLREEAMEGRTDVVEGLTREATTFYDYVLQLAFDDGLVPADARDPLKKLMLRIVEMLQDTIDVLDFWKKPVDDEQVENIVESKHYWIYKSLAEWRELNATQVLREYKSGEGFLYLGRAYRLLLTSNQGAPLQLKNGRFMLRRDLVERGEIAAAKAAFRDYYTTRGLERIRRRVVYFSPKVGVEPKGVDVRELGHRWASCSPGGKLAFHWKCMMAPLTIIDYIAVHELCHFHHRDHTDAFWNEVDKVMPDFSERKEWLRKNGAGLDV